MRKMIKRSSRRGLLGILMLLLAAPPSAFAQIPPPYPPPPAGAVAPPTFRQEELDQLLAPIALYPDALLAQILMASTYPLEVVQAARWVKAYPNVTGPQLEVAIQQQPWDPSVKSLTAFPQVLAMMDANLEWTQRLGDAFLAQRQDVMVTVQMLRAKAQAAGYLQSTPQQTVIVEPQIIRIEPVSPQIVYVPIYNPVVVYGPWWWPAYRPFYWYPRGYVVGPSVFSFGLGMAVGAALWGGFDWGHRNVNIVNVNHYNTFNRTNVTNVTNVTNITNVTTWQHDPGHRWGVPYRDPGVGQRFGQGPRPGAPAREAFRGRPQAAPPPPPQSGVDRRPGAGPGPRITSVPQGGSGQPQPPAPPRRSEPQRPGAGPGPSISRGPEAGPGLRQPPAPPRQPGALEGLGHGGDTRNFSDRGRMSRGTTATPKPVPSAPAPRSPEIKGGARPAPNVPAGGAGGERKGAASRPPNEKAQRPATGGN